MPERKKYKKLLPEEIQKIRKLYAEGNISYSKLGVMFGVTDPTVGYHVNEEFRERRKKYARERSHARGKEYSRNYMKNRYNSDPAFRESMKKSHVQWRRKNKDKTNKYLREHLFSCKQCNRDFAYPKSVITRTQTSGKCHRCGTVVVKRFSGVVA